MQCPTCGATNPDSATFCSLCLSTFAATEAAAPAPAQIAQPAQVAPVAPIPAPEWASQPSPAPSPDTAPGASAETAGTLDTEAAAEAYLDSFRTPAKTSILTTPIESKLGVDPGLAKTLGKFGALPVILIGIIAWVVTGGPGAVAKGKLVEVPVPAAAVRLGSVVGATHGPMGGAYDEERIEALSSHLFAVKAREKALLEYYKTGPGAKTLAEAGWTGPEERSNSIVEPDNLQWVRRVPFGFNRQERQYLHVGVGGRYLAYDLDEAKVPSGNSVIRVWCESLAMEKIEFPVR